MRFINAEESSHSITEKRRRETETTTSARRCTITRVSLKKGVEHEDLSPNLPKAPKIKAGNVF